LVATTRRALPKSSAVTESSLRPISSLMTVPPVSVAMSRSISLRRSPKPGALTARTEIVPLSLFTTSVARASPSTSSAMIRTGLPCWTPSRAPEHVLDARDLLVGDQDEAFSRTASIRSGLVTKYAEM
jgi:hypothetical protein